MRFGKSKRFLILGSIHHAHRLFTLSGWDLLLKRQVSVNSESVSVLCWKNGPDMPQITILNHNYSILSGSPQCDSSFYINSPVLYFRLLTAEPPVTFLLKDFYYKYIINTIGIISPCTLQFRREMRLILH